VLFSSSACFPVGVGVEIIKKLTSETREDVTMQMDLKTAPLKTLGKETFAEGKQACDLHTEVQVAIRILGNGQKNDYSNKTEIDIFKVLDQPNIINTTAHTYLVMEHAACGDLLSHTEKVCHLQEEQALYIFAVPYCDKNGIAYKDTKLDNILLDDKGSIKPCDFGLFIRVFSGQRSKGSCGTLEYCASELFTDIEYDARAVDIWSMGVVTACFHSKHRPIQTGRRRC
ncbi:sperm motility kinase X-like protein, partial [Cricetulus griseus]